MDRMIVPLLIDFRTQFPSIVVEVAVRNALLDLNKRQADVTLRVASDPPEALVGVRLARVEFAIYGAKTYLDRRNSRSPHEMEWLAPDAWLSETPVGRWLQTAIASERVVAKADSFIVLRERAEAGLGVAALPCFVGRCSPDLTQVGLLPEATLNDLWLLTHRDSRQSARVRAFMDHIATGIRQQRSIFEAIKSTE